MTNGPQKRLRQLIFPLVAAAIALATLSIAAPADAQTAGIPSVGKRFAERGPYSVTVQREPTHTYYSPATLGLGGVRHPVILWGNGTTARPPIYEMLLRHLASHGFIVVAAETPDAGTGREMLAGLDNVARFNSEPGNRFFGVVDLSRVGATGHSQGGGGAVEAGSDPRVDTIFPLEPDRGAAAAVRGPALMMAGEWDTLVEPQSVRAAYQALRAPGGYAELKYATHLTPLVDGGGFRFAATAWARWQLMDDANGRAQFVGARCGLCTSTAWKYEVNAAFPGA
jgi:alpha-beta hydrolase superfamily lysophospholipase